MKLLPLRKEKKHILLLSLSFQILSPVSERKHL